MAKIDLKQNVGAKPFAMPSGQRDYVGAQGAGLSAMERADDKLARGMRQVSDTLYGVTMNMSETRNRQENLAGQTAYYEIQESNKQKLLADIESGKFDGKDGAAKFKEASEKVRFSNNEKFQKWCDGNVSADFVREALVLQSKDADAHNFASLGGAMAKHIVHKTRTLAEEGMRRSAEDGNVENVLKWSETMKGNFSPELVDAATAPFLRAAVMTNVESEMTATAEMFNDADRKTAIAERVKRYEAALEDRSVLAGGEYLSDKDVRKYLQAYKGLGDKKEILIKQKVQDSVKIRTERLLESKDKEFELRQKNLEKFINESPYLDDLGRIEAREYVQKRFLAVRAFDEKMQEAQKKAVKDAFDTRTGEVLEARLLGKDIDLSDAELGGIKVFKNALNEEFSVDSKNEKGKILASITEKKRAHIAKLEDAIANYDPKLDDGAYARALMMQLEASFTDVADVEDLSGGAAQYIKKSVPGYMGIPTSIEEANPEWKGSAKESSKSESASLSEKRKISGHLIYDPEAQGRLRRELAQKMGIYPDANIKISDVRAISKPMLEGAVGRKPEKLSAYQQQIWGEISLAFEKRVMTAGFDDIKEAADWMKKDPYVATVRAKLAMLSSVNDAAQFDTSFAHQSEIIKKAPKMNDTFSVFGNLEAQYQKMRGAQNQPNETKE